ncbi:MAG: caspase family protein [Desulfobacteraceae bacterium]
MKKFFVILFLLTIPVNSRASQEVFLQLDSMGHQGKITDVCVTKNKKYIVSSSVDKTIRVWDIKSGKEEKKILGEIGPGSEGQIYAAAISPDNRFLASAGYLAGKFVKDKTGIRIYDFESGSLLQVLKSHSNVVVDLNFDDSGNYLVSGSSDSKIKVWKKNKNRFEIYKTFDHHKGPVYSAGFLNKNNKTYVVSGGWDKKIYLSGLNTSDLKSFSASEKIGSVAVSDKHIAACGYNREILIFNHDLKLLKKIECPAEPSGLSFSPDGNYLASGSAKNPFNAYIYDAKNSFEKITQFAEHENLVRSTCFIDNQTIVSGGGNNNEILVWNIFSGAVKTKITGAGKPLWSVGLDNSKIAFGQKWTANSGKSDFEKIIDLNDFSIKADDSFDNFKRINSKYKSYSLSLKRGGEYNFTDAILEVKKNNTKVAEIKNGYGHKSFGFTDSGVIISGADSGNLRAYTENGRLLARFDGHTGDVWSIASQGNVLASAAHDQTIRLWNLDELDKNSKKPKIIYPYLNIFISENNEWVVWSKSGYYNSSIEGDRFIGFHVNNGPEKESDYFPSSRFYKTYYTPELIENIIKLESEQKALLYTKQKKKILNADTQKILPPKIILNSPKEIETRTDKVMIDFYVDKNSQNQITNISVLLNGREIKDRALKRKKQDGLLRIKKEIVLDQKENIIKIYAENEYSKSNPVFISARMTREQDEKLYKPNLYLLSIGVSEYTDSSLNLDFASTDAKAFARIFENQKNKIYKDVKINLITDSKATRINILKGLNWIKKEATQKDVVMLFIAGHGINDDFNTWFFLPHDADSEFLEGTGVEWTKFDSLVKNLPSKVILFADSCHSGNIAGSKKRSADITGALKELVSAGTGQIIMTATTGNSFAYENKKWGHGAFTKALKDGLEKGYADFSNDGVISVKELDFYVTDRVKKLTDGKQKPTTIIPESVPDFPVAVK